MEIVTIGHTSIDRVKINGQEKTQLGGAAVYSAMAAKILSKTGVVSRVGQDFPAGFLGQLRKARIDTSGIKTVPGKSTTFSIEYDDKGAASYTSYNLNAGIHIRAEDIPKKYLRARAFHIAPMAASKQRAILDYLRENTSALVSLNTHAAYFLKYRKKLLEMVSRVDVFSINDYEAMRLTDTRSMEHALNVFKRIEHKLIIVTMGVYGSVVVQGGVAKFSPSVFQPEVVDLTGCGDSFAGGFLACYLSTGDPLLSANIANSVASIVATDWNFRAVRKLRFSSWEAFQEFVVARQRRLASSQRPLEQFF